jgi:CheY-like chemotaxis protein
VNTSCLERATALSADFSNIKDWESRYRRVIEQGHALSPLEAHEREGDRPPCAIIMLTASALPSQAELAQHAGCNALLIKPVTPARLIETIGRVVPA